MARIRRLEIANFRGIREFVWLPSPGVNCLIGAGDSGKSTVLDAIDLCLGARRSISLTDADFHLLDVAAPIVISITLGDLDDSLKNLEVYGPFLRGFRSDTGALEDEPDKDAETVVTVKLTVGADLEPSWGLMSARADAEGASRNLSWADRTRIAPLRIGALADYHLGWRRGSVLNRLSDVQADASGALAKAAREARAVFGAEVAGQLGETLQLVGDAAEQLGIAGVQGVQALLDAHAVSFGDGTITLHDGRGVPLSALGVGSKRLLTAGLQRRVDGSPRVVLVDELEHGLEPHRIVRLLASLGAKDDEPSIQVFMTTHSPIALRELTGGQLFVIRASQGRHAAHPVGVDDAIQGTVRLHPEAFFAESVVLCEGASEVGLIRGVDQFRSAGDSVSLLAMGSALVDCGGGAAERPFVRATALQALGYRTAVLRDADVEMSKSVVSEYTKAGGRLFSWRDGRALEDELFLSLDSASVLRLVELAVELHGEALINDHIKSASSNAIDLAGVRADGLAAAGVQKVTRETLGRAARFKKAGWFKSVTGMERVGRDIVAPALKEADAEFSQMLQSLFDWIAKDGE